MKNWSISNENWQVDKYIKVYLTLLNEMRQV